MKLRDKFKDEKYFEKFILETIELIMSSERKLTNNEYHPSTVEAARIRQYSRIVELIIAKYSAGYDI